MVFSDGKPFLLTTGTIEPRKNQAFLLDVYQEFRDRGGDAIPLIFAGKMGWMMDGFEDRVAASPWAGDIHILGYVSDGELAWLYQHCLVNLYPSHYEGFGLPVLEAMGFGAPLICSNSTSIPEVIGEAGILLAPNDHAAWVDALESMRAKPDRRMELKKRASSRIASFRWKKSTEQVTRLYTSLAH